jgi:hypothetical protein
MPWKTEKSRFWSEMTELSSWRNERPLRRAEPTWRPILDCTYSVERYIEVHERPMTSLNWVDIGVAYVLPSSSNEGGLLAHSVMRSSTSFETALYSSDSSQTCRKGDRASEEQQGSAARLTAAWERPRETYLSPVLALGERARDDVDHKLGRVVVLLGLDAVAGKVVLHVGAVLAEVAKVAATGAEEGKVRS